MGKPTERFMRRGASKRQGSGWRIEVIAEILYLTAQRRCLEPAVENRERRKTVFRFENGVAAGAYALSDAADCAQTDYGECSQSSVILLCGEVRCTMREIVPKKRPDVQR